MANNSKLPALLLAGAAIGAAAWYLFGTEEGKKTVSSLSDSLKEYSDTALDKAKETIADLKEKANSI